MRERTFDRCDFSVAGALISASAAPYCVRERRWGGGWGWIETGLSEWKVDGSKNNSFDISCSSPASAAVFIASSWSTDISCSGSLSVDTCLRAVSFYGRVFFSSSCEPVTSHTRREWTLPTCRSTSSVTSSLPSSACRTTASPSQRPYRSTPARPSSPSPPRIRTCR